ncbi:MAG: Holliday junction resolvase RuvX [Pseudomonadota bacterium]
MTFDFGIRQMGVAVGNPVLETATPLPVLHARDGIPNWQDLADLIAEWQPDLLLVGDPLNMDGSDSELCEKARKFARRLHGRFGLEVALVDERLSSFEAKQLAREHGHRGDYKSQPVDSLAAELIFKSWLAQKNAP